jgi:hypothetical protein
VSESAPGSSFSKELSGDLERGRRNGCVGHVLLSETDRVRVWSLSLAPGERIGFYKHVLDYFWLCHTSDRSRSNHENGRTYIKDYVPGEIVQHSYARGEYKIHDLENIGDTVLSFTTVELKPSANDPLPVPDHVRPNYRS